MSTSRAAALDMSAIGLSGLCLIHCLALPLLAAFLPVAGVVGENEWVHRALVVVAVPVSLLALVRNHDRPGFALRFGVALTGIALLIAGALVEALHDFETILTVAGGLVLASAHLLNWFSHSRE